VRSFANAQDDNRGSIVRGNTVMLSRSEASRDPAREILRFAQNDNGVPIRLSSPDVSTLVSSIPRLQCFCNFRQPPIQKRLLFRIKT
jgi:hypothetical protein